MRATILFVILTASLAACGDTDRPLRDMRSSGAGPDEFAVIPLNPLALPPATALPEPTPGGTNLTDRTPNEDAIAALGGAASALVAGGIPTQDAALVAQAGRYGVDANIRAQLAAEDEQILERARLSNVFNPLGRDRYFPAYSNQALNADAELRRLGALGVTVPNRPTAQTTPTAEPGGATAQQSSVAVEEAEVNCIFTTVGDPEGRLRRVCTPVLEEDG